MYEDFVLGLRSIGLGIILGLMILAIQAIVIQFIHKKSPSTNPVERFVQQITYSGTAL